jgi:hypothetical protein
VSICESNTSSIMGCCFCKNLDFLCLDGLLFLGLCNMVYQEMCNKHGFFWNFCNVFNFFFFFYYSSNENSLDICFF